MCFLGLLLLLVLETIAPLVFAGVVFARVFDLGDRFEITPSFANLDLHCENRLPQETEIVKPPLLKTLWVDQLTTVRRTQTLWASHPWTF